MMFQWFGANTFVALCYDVVAFNSTALKHARTHTDDLGLIRKLSIWRTFWTYHFLSDAPWTMVHASVGPLEAERGEERR